MVDTLDIARSCLRRWYVFVPVVLLAVAGGYQLAAQRAPSYSAVSVVTMYFPTQNLPQPTVTNGQVTQPVDPRLYNTLFQSGGVQLLVNSLVTDMTSDDVLRTLASEGHHTGYVVSIDKSNGNLIDVQAKGPDSRDVLATVNSLVTLVNDRLIALQTRAGAPANSQYHAFTVSPATRAIEKPASKSKLLIAITGVGVLGAAGLSVLFDGYSRRRGSRRRPAPTRGFDAGVPGGMPGLPSTERSAAGVPGSTSNPGA
jgi:hypothetical protein